jgi:hypothetical protein
VKTALVTALVLLHLVSVAVFIWTDLPSDSPDVISSALRLYRNLSGSFRDYAFFAPAVASDIKAGFLLEDAAGQTTFLNFTTANREIAFRYNCIISAAMRDTRARDLFAQSWAAFLLGGHPQAVRVTVVAKTLRIPAMSEYRAGHRPEWETLYLSTFGRRTDDPSSQ